MAAGTFWSISRPSVWTSCWRWHRAGNAITYLIRYEACTFLTCVRVCYSNVKTVRAVLTLTKHFTGTYQPLLWYWRIMMDRMASHWSDRWGCDWLCLTNNGNSATRTLARMVYLQLSDVQPYYLCIAFVFEFFVSFVVYHSGIFWQLSTASVCG